MSEIAALQGAANATEPASSKSAPRARAVDRTHLLFLKQVFSALFTSKCTLGDDVISREQFAAVTLKTIIWTRTAKTLSLCKASRRMQQGGPRSSRHGSSASGPVVGTVGGVGRARSGLCTRCRGAAALRDLRSFKSDLNDLNELNDL